MDAVTVLYDDECGICTRLAAWLEVRPGMSVAPIDSGVGAVLLRDLSPAERIASVHVIEASGRRSSGGAALAPLLRRLPLGRFTATALEALPVASERLYRLVARHRRALSCLTRLGPCRVPTHQDRYKGAGCPEIGLSQGDRGRSTAPLCSRPGPE